MLFRRFEWHKDTNIFLILNGYCQTFDLQFRRTNFNNYLCRTYVTSTMNRQKDETQPSKEGILRQSVPYTELFFYQKADAIYRLTYIFCQRFLPKYGDRTVDQMVQAARSGKQNIVEGIEDGNTSTEMELKLLNVSRSS